MNFTQQVRRGDLPAQLQAVYDQSVAVGGTASNFVSIGAAVAPDVLRWYIDGFYAQIFYGGRVDLRSMELLRVKFSLEHGCNTCHRNNVPAAATAGITEEQIASLHDYEQGLFSERDKTLLRLADQMLMHRPEGFISAELFGQLRRHFDEGQIFELGVAAGVMAGMQKFLFAFDLTERMDNCPVKRPAVA